MRQLAASKSTLDFRWSMIACSSPVARLVEVALCLDDEEAGRHAGLELLFLGLEPLLGQGP